MSNCDEDPTVYNGHFEVHVLIKRAVREIWPQYLDKSSWVTTHDVEQVYGKPGTVGSITRVSFKRAAEVGLPRPHFHYCKIIKLEQEKESLIKTYSADGGSYGMRLTGFDHMRFSAVGANTRATFSIFLEARSEAIAKDPAAFNLDGSRVGMLGNLNNLKRILESN